MTSPPGLFSFSTTALARFDALAKLITARGSGITALQLRDLGALVRELDREAPDVDRVARFLEALDLTEDEVAELPGLAGAP